MKNDEYTIPGQMAEQPLETALQAAEIIQRSPERKAGVYERIKDAEERIHGYRRTALEIEKNQPEQGLFEVILRGRRQKVTLEGLIEAESELGGLAYNAAEISTPELKVVDRFWLSHKGSSALSNANHLGDWYHVREFYDKFGRKLNEITLHFETHPAKLNKLHDGKPVELTIAELETLVRAIEIYEMRVREQLYPFDQEIFDLLEEIDAEHFAVPDSLEERFGKEIVARVIEAYKAQKGISQLQMPNNVDEFMTRSTPIPNTVEAMFGEQTVEQITNDLRTKL